MQFLRFVLATVVGLIFFGFIMFFVFLGILGVATKEKEVTIKEKSVLHLKFDKPIVERAGDNPLEDINIPLGKSAAIGLVNLKEVLANAKVDNNIKGIFLDLSTLITNPASLEEIRNALLDFKKSKKFIYAYSEFYTEGAYYLASVSDKIVLNPTGQLEFNGLSVQSLFFKGTLDKLGIQPEIFKVGEYKNAFESLVNDKMSEQSKYQTSQLINSIYDNFLTNISASRNLSKEALETISDSMLVRNPKDALKYKLITQLGYYDEVLEMMRAKLNVKTIKDLELVTYKTYRKVENTIASSSSKNKIAIIIAEGEIRKEKAGNEGISSDEISEELRKVRADKNVKAVVLRINSPGGSATASDAMWREIMLTRKVKPVIASMSDYAASGGYYMAMACNKIVAQPNTITGSIGVISLLFNAEKFLEEKLGITSDGVKTGHYSDIITVTRPLNESEKRIIQNSAENFYEIFTSKAAQGRNLPLDSIKKMASGRVWSGTQAVQNGLVDKLGGLEEAISLAASAAKLGKDYKIRYYPTEKSFLENLLGDFAGDSQTRLMEKQLGAFAPYAKEFLKLKRMVGVQARMIDPIEVNY